MVWEELLGISARMEYNDLFAVSRPVNCPRSLQRCCLDRPRFPATNREPPSARRPAGLAHLSWCRPGSPPHRLQANGTASTAPGAPPLGARRYTSETAAESPPAGRDIPPQLTPGPGYPSWREPRRRRGTRFPVAAGCRCHWMAEAEESSGPPGWWGTWRGMRRTWMH